jgi:hypothetical protein
MSDGSTWLSSLDLSSAITSSDPKRAAVAEKFFSNLMSVPLRADHLLSSSELVRAFSNQLEHTIHESTADNPREYKSRVFTLNFNLSDKRNAELKERILSGEFSPESLAGADADTIASNELRKQREEQREKYFTTQVVKHDEVIEQEDDKKEEVLEEPAHDQEVDVPVFSPPPETKRQKVLHEDTATLELIGLESEVMEDVTGTTTTPRTMNEPTVDHHTAVKALHEYVDKIGERLKLIQYESQRRFSISFLDYIRKHISR